MRHVFITTAREGKLQDYIKMHDNIYPVRRFSQPHSSLVCK